MSNTNIEVQASIIHQIIKDLNHTTEVPPLLRDKLHADYQQVIKLIEFLESQLEKNGLAHSKLKKFDRSNTLGQVLAQYMFEMPSLMYLTYTRTTNRGANNIYIQKVIGFYPFSSRLPAPTNENETINIFEAESIFQTRLRRISKLLTKALHYHIYKEAMTTGDHLPIIFYRQNGINYLYIALLSLKDNITINENTGEILDIKHIDAGALKVACRINLDSLNKHKENNLDDNATNNYVSWIQKGKALKIHEYIQDFLPVLVRIDDKSATTKAIVTLEKYLKQSTLPDNAKKEVHKDVLALFKRRAEDKQPISLVEDVDPILTAKAEAYSIDISEEDSFKTFREQNGYGPDDEDNSNIFSPSREPLKNFEIFDLIVGDDEFIKISGKQSLIGDKIRLSPDEDNPELIIRLDPNELEKVKIEFAKANRYESDADENS
ncbi:nucleoid-associated protein [Psychrobacter okhotskensis]|uniref:nucleoid-associated protein n=1 Tax=Psychrobacter okhotskensis TaxID=212403 RepID=UPI001566D80C|nr:nucleoid-associated protein [Psychrobacter okhotskensis]NRD69510.1 nucleoid-associated protein [Psychrobacter okhotskensis]